jgi:hypothetical protein
MIALSRTGFACYKSPSQLYTQLDRAWLIDCHRKTMCNLCSKGPAAIRELAKAMRDLTGNLQPSPAVFPNRMAP